jgi:hypothetical protein
MDKKAVKPLNLRNGNFALWIFLYTVFNVSLIKNQSYFIKLEKNRRIFFQLFIH